MIKSPERKLMEAIFSGPDKRTVIFDEDGGEDLSLEADDETITIYQTIIGCDEESVVLTRFTAKQLIDLLRKFVDAN